MWVLLNQLDQELKAAHTAEAAFRRVIYTAEAAFRRVIYNSRIHSETNLVTQQVSHHFLCNNTV